MNNSPDYLYIPIPWLQEPLHPITVRQYQLSAGVLYHNTTYTGTDSQPTDGILEVSETATTQQIRDAYKR
jgi:hypothetical protein